MSDSRDDFIIAIRYALLKKGAKQKFSLFFLILLSVSIITLDKLSFPFMSPTRALLNDLVYHVSVVSSQPLKLRKYLIQKTKKHYGIVKENKFLREEMEFLKQQKFNNAFLKSENEVLKKSIGLYEAKKNKQIEPIYAKVMLDTGSPFLKSVLINKGTNKNVKKGMTVFYKNNLMGTVIETNYLSSRVLLLTDLNSKIPVIIEGTDINAILEGKGSKIDLQLNYLPDGYELENNKVIFTSGKDGFLSQGIPVAKTYLNKKNKILIKLLGDPDQALIVLITNGQIRTK
tara:strand:+ start:297 stop:1157 length:861 start_codon:yes stop_codon:yes gene_type:complete